MMDLFRKSLLALLSCMLLTSGCLIYGSRVETFPELWISGAAYNAKNEPLSGCTINFLAPSRPVFAGGVMTVLDTANPLESPHIGAQAVVTADGRFSCVLPERNLRGEFQRYMASNKEKYFAPENIVMFSMAEDPETTYIVHIAGENAAICRAFLDDGSGLRTERVEEQKASAHFEQETEHDTLTLRVVF